MFKESVTAKGSVEGAAAHRNNPEAIKNRAELSELFKAHEDLEDKLRVSQGKKPFRNPNAIPPEQKKAREEATANNYLEKTIPSQYEEQILNHALKNMSGDSPEKSKLQKMANEAASKRKENAKGESTYTRLLGNNHPEWTKNKNTVREKVAKSFLSGERGPELKKMAEDFQAAEEETYKRWPSLRGL